VGIQSCFAYILNDSDVITWLSVVYLLVSKVYVALLSIMIAPDNISDCHSTITFGAAHANYFLKAPAVVTLVTRGV
jgi:hypothetical protein